MTKPRNYDYQIQYIDNTYRIISWTKKDYKTVGTAMENDQSVVMLEDGIFRLHDIRAIVLLPDEPELTEAEKAAQEDNRMTEWGFVDQQTAEWLKTAGIDLSKGVSQ